MTEAGVNVAALQREQLEAARRLLAPETFAYLDAGAGQQVTRRAAETSWDGYRLRPRVLVDVSAVDTSTTLFGAPVAMPVLVPPTAYHRLCHPEGEAATARATRAAGSLFTLSTRASIPFEQAADAAGGPWWFQVYLTHDPVVWRGAALRAAEAGATALVLNLGRHVPEGADAAAAIEQSRQGTVEAIGELAALTGLPVLVKGVLRGDEALRCLDARPRRESAQALPEVVAAVGRHAPVLVDGGVRDGLDVLTALALGASAVLIGRPVLRALAELTRDLVSSAHDRR